MFRVAQKAVLLATAGCAGALLLFAIYYIAPAGTTAQVNNVSDGVVKPPALIPRENQTHSDASANAVLGTISLNPVHPSTTWRQELVAQHPSLRSAFVTLNKDGTPESLALAAQLASACAQYKFVARFDVNQIGKHIPQDIWPQYRASHESLLLRCSDFSSSPLEMAGILREARAAAKKVDLLGRIGEELVRAIVAEKEVDRNYLEGFLAKLSPRLVAESGPLFFYADRADGFAQPGEESLWQMAAVLATCKLGNDCSSGSYFSITSCIGLGYCGSNGLETMVGESVQLTPSQKRRVAEATARVLTRYQTNLGSREEKK